LDRDLKNSFSSLYSEKTDRQMVQKLLVVRRLHFY